MPLLLGSADPEKETPQETVRNVLALCVDDLTPMQCEKSEKHNREWLKRKVKSGGGGQFHNFIKQELIPMI
jgi:predicted alpha/beta superfamily hydrolase